MKAPRFAAALLAACQHWMDRATLIDPKSDLNAVANRTRAMEAAEEMPKVVCLCGSTKFMDAFQEANRIETLAGNIVLSVGFFGHQHEGELDPTVKAALDVLHKRKIDLADEVLVLNVGGYVGFSTKSEIAYAISHGVPVRWLDPAAAGYAVL